MRLYGLVGPSGTGKSHRAPALAQSLGIEYIIDDGLLISSGTIVAGISAKKEKTKIGSVKTAVFTSDDHAFEVSHAIKSRNVESLLILGTSDAMVKKIADRLGLSDTMKIIHIEDIATKSEMQAALNMRRNLGKHEIPVPTMELKKDFSGFYLDPLNVFKRKQSGGYEVVGEKTVVRPTFSYMGSFSISDYAIYQLLEHVVKKNPHVASIARFRAENSPAGIKIETDFVIFFGTNIPDAMRELKKKITEEIERVTSINIVKLTLSAVSIEKRQ